MSANNWTAYLVGGLLHSVWVAPAAALLGGVATLVWLVGCSWVVGWFGGRFMVPDYWIGGVWAALGGGVYVFIILSLIDEMRDEEGD